MTSNLDWNEYFIRMCYLVSSKSKDNSTKIGSVLVRDRAVISQGFNGLPIGCDDKKIERFERPNKYSYFEHSERNCIYLAAKNGINTNNSELFTLSIPCSDCARGLIQSGVKKVTYHLQHTTTFARENEKWAESLEKSQIMFNESGIELITFDKLLGFSAVINGKDFEI